MGYYDKEKNISVLVGKTIKTINEDGNHVSITCTDGSAYEMYHMQDCCESVFINDIKGHLPNLVDKVILDAEENVSGDWPEDVPVPDYNESYTWTTYTLTSKNEVVVIRWLGTSNGYYSESVYFEETHTPIELKEKL